jgi:hypothetical protein
VRASDGGSIYRPPNEERYCTLAHLDTEEQILATAKRTVRQFVSCEQAWASVECTELNAEQRNVVVMMLTAAVATAVLVAPAGAGKSHTMAEFARLWTTFISILRPTVHGSSVHSSTIISNNRDCKRLVREIDTVLQFRQTSRKEAKRFLQAARQLAVRTSPVWAPSGDLLKVRWT